MLTSFLALSFLLLTGGATAKRKQQPHKQKLRTQAVDVGVEAIVEDPDMPMQPGIPGVDGGTTTVTTDENGMSTVDVPAGPVETDTVEDTLPDGAEQTSGENPATGNVPPGGTGTDSDGIQLQPPPTPPPTKRPTQAPTSRPTKAPTPPPPTNPPTPPPTKAPTPPPTHPKKNLPVQDVDVAEIEVIVEDPDTPVSTVEAICTIPEELDQSDEVTYIDIDDDLPEVKEFCVDFNRGYDDPTTGNAVWSTDGFAPCPGYFSRVEVYNSGDSGSGTPPGFPYGDPKTHSGQGDFYLHMRDRAGASLACGSQGPYIGDWTSLTCEDGACYKLCFDILINYDGCNPGNPRCTEVNTTTGKSYINIKPTIMIQGGAPTYYRSAFRANIDVHGKNGVNSGWHRVCAPLQPPHSNGTLPSSPEGQWFMLNGPCNTLGGVDCNGGYTGVPANCTWCDMFKDVTAINLPIDPTGNPAERFGYDNICIEKSSSCKDNCQPEPLCYWQHDFDCKAAKKLEGWTKVLELSKFFDKKTSACCVLKNSCPNRCELAEQEYLALLLNVASGKVLKKCCVKDDCGKRTTVIEIAEQIDELLYQKGRTEYDCSKAMTLAAGINTGSTFCNKVQPNNVSNGGAEKKTENGTNNNQ